MEAAVLDQKIDALRMAFAGGLIVPGDDDYEEARKVFNGMIDRHPAVIARPGNEHDVVAALALARQAGLPVAVRGGGHSAPGFATVEGGLLIDLSGMKSIEVDPEARTATAAAGLTWGEFDAATQEHGLAVTGGRVSSTGISGLTLGSGSGWLERKLGLALDHLVSARVVTADGEVVTASAEENPELFWGLRGGGGNFGIVTQFVYRLHKIGPVIYGGMLAFPFPRAAEVMRLYRDLIESAPDDLGGGLALMTAPPEPFVPVEAQGQRMLGVIVAWTGDHGEGEEAIRPLRDAGPVVDIVGPMPYVALQQMLDAGNPGGHMNYFKAEFMQELADEAIDLMVAGAADFPSPLSLVLLQPMGGAYARVFPDATALGGRDAKWLYHCLTVWVDPAENEQQIAVTREFADKLLPHTRPGVHPNYVSDEGAERVLSFYGEDHLARLRALKDQWDPENVFRLNQNITPSGS